MTEVLLSSNNLTIGYSFNRRTPLIVLADASVTLISGELVCLIGPNGAGKSTLMRTLAGMHSPLSGHVTIFENDVHKLKTSELAKRVSVILTDPVDVGNLSAYALVALGRYPYTDWSGRLMPHDKALIEWAMRAVGVNHFASRNFNELSDGERQKVLIARALAQDTPLILLDEPTAYLDLPRRVEMMQMLRDLAHSTGKALLLSTHDLDLALRSADRIWLLPMGGPLQEGAPEDLILSHAFEAAFTSEGAFFDNRIGSFRLNSANNLDVLVIGDDDLQVYWTQRALEREGYNVLLFADAATSIRVEVNNDSDVIIWHVIQDDVPVEFKSLYEMTAFIRQNLAAVPIDACQI